MDAIEQSVKNKLIKEQNVLFEKSMRAYNATIILNIIIVALLIFGIYNPIYLTGYNISWVSFLILIFTLIDLKNKKFEYKFNKAMLLMLEDSEV